MPLNQAEIEELSRILDARAGGGRNERPKLRLIIPPTPKLLDQIAREAHLRRIMHLKRFYRLEWLVDQETFNVANVSCLEDCDLIRLLNFMEHARECIVEGVSFEDAGLVRTLRSPVVAPPPSSAAFNRQAERDADCASASLVDLLKTANYDAPQDGPPF